MKMLNNRLWSALLLALLGLGASAATLAGCNTTEGIGEDLGNAGDAIDEAAEDSGAN